jgi:hypothetical protein
VSGTLNKNIVLTVRAQFEKKCVKILLDSHKELASKGRNFRDSKENAITVQLLGLMRKHKLSSDIEITREHYEDTDAVYAGLDDPDESPRIDIKFMTWTSSQKAYYFFEAKNLYENNFTKAGKKSPISANTYQKRYIKTGIDNFTSGAYPNGFLVGYVLEGKPEKIADKINGLLKAAGRNTECLTKISEAGKIQYCFSSNHTGKNLSKLAHYFLKFT